MNLLATQDLLLLNAVAVLLATLTGYEGLVRPRMLGRPARWRRVGRTALQAASAAALHAALVLGYAAGAYPGSRALSAPVLQDAYRPAVALVEFRVTFVISAAVTRRWLGRHRRTVAQVSA